MHITILKYTACFANCSEYICEYPANLLIFGIPLFEPLQQILVVEGYKHHSPNYTMRTYPDEKWETIAFPPDALRLKYAVSNYGRIVSYADDFENAKLLKGGKLGGYPIFGCRPYGKSKTLYIHKLVAEHFIPKKSEDEDFVIHLDFNKSNNHVANLAWADKARMTAHQQKNPHVLAGREKRKNQHQHQGHKLTSTDVMRIKKKIFDPNRKTRLKIIAKQFGISEMQLYRIKSGENWSHVKIDEPSSDAGRAKSKKDGK